MKKSLYTCFSWSLISGSRQIQSFRHFTWNFSRVTRKSRFTVIQWDWFPGFETDGLNAAMSSSMLLSFKNQTQIRLGSLILSRLKKVIPRGPSGRTSVASRTLTTLPSVPRIRRPPNRMPPDLHFRCSEWIWCHRRECPWCRVSDRLKSGKPDRLSPAFPSDQPPPALIQARFLISELPFKDSKSHSSVRWIQEKPSGSTPCRTMIFRNWRPQDWEPTRWSTNRPSTKFWFLEIPFTGQIKGKNKKHAWWTPVQRNRERMHVIMRYQPRIFAAVRNNGGGDVNDFIFVYLGIPTWPPLGFNPIPIARQCSF
jgi:hypothetical protein